MMGRLPNKLLTTTFWDAYNEERNFTLLAIVPRKQE